MGQSGYYLCFVASCEVENSLRVKNRVRKSPSMPQWLYPLKACPQGFVYFLFYYFDNSLFSFGYSIN